MFVLFKSQVPIHKIFTYNTDVLLLKVGAYKYYPPCKSIDRASFKLDLLEYPL